MSNVVSELVALLTLKVDPNSFAGAFKQFEAVKSVANAVIATVEGVGRAVYDMISDAAAYGLQVSKLSAQLGLTKSQVQEWSYVAERSGVSVQKLATGVRMFERQLFTLTHGGRVKMTQAALNELGITQADITAAMNSPEGINSAFAKLATKFHEMGPTAERAALAQQIFGARSSEILAALDQGGEAIDKLLKKYKELGAELSDRQIHRLTEAAGAFTDVKTQITGYMRQAVAEVAPAFTSLAQGLSSWLSAHKEQLKGILEWLLGKAAAVAHLIGRALGGVFDILMAAWPQIRTTLNSVWFLFKQIARILGPVLGVQLKLLMHFILQFASMLGTMAEVVGTALEGIADLIGGIVDAVESAAHGMIQPFIDAWDTIKGVFADARDWIGDHIPGAKWVENKIGIGGSPTENAINAVMAQKHAGAGGIAGLAASAADAAKKHITVHAPTQVNVNLHGTDPQKSAAAVQAAQTDAAQRAWRQAMAASADGSGTTGGQ